MVIQTAKTNYSKREISKIILACQTLKNNGLGDKTPNEISIDIKQIIDNHSKYK